jgi:hypothetical protein
MVGQPDAGTWTSGNVSGAAGPAQAAPASAQKHRRQGSELNRPSCSHGMSRSV